MTPHFLEIYDKQNRLLLMSNVQVRQLQSYLCYIGLGSLQQKMEMHVVVTMNLLVSLSRDQKSPLVFLENNFTSIKNTHSDDCKQGYREEQQSMGSS